MRRRMGMVPPSFVVFLSSHPLPLPASSITARGLCPPVPHLASSRHDRWTPHCRRYRHSSRAYFYAVGARLSCEHAVA
ncbi:hypothetical protein BU26DRAFT_76746 [Trematosphaeria pertusa]|uniref:Uncharacterized protein n=1 Tax=Trematosphaeria pertusa TaxID=390896 RepID=A0A6A6I4E7_9PLEO|nr:uncharacterized protein BU26DRAFT_76746 [Trematosphaeria pertusa]KAF2245089.1 hypothetical protein BU26DRAFT_76746 [Trematosphaeria pertusa]